MKWNLHYALQEGKSVEPEGKNIKRICAVFEANSPEEAKEKAFSALRNKAAFAAYAASEGCESAILYVVRFALFDEEKHYRFFLKENGGENDVRFLLGGSADECMHT